jgi:hypothetical protein
VDDDRDDDRGGQERHERVEQMLGATLHGAATVAASGDRRILREQ